MKCTIIRHAEKEEETGGFYNPELDRQDTPISKQGQLQAQRLLPVFHDQPISAIYVSAYQRTLQTIEPLARQLQLMPVVDSRLNEIHNGDIEGLSDDQVRGTYPDVWNAFLERKADFRFPGGETGEEAQKRIAGFMEEKRPIHSNEQIILVSHDGLIRLLMCYIVGIPVYRRWNFEVDFCGIMEIVYQPNYGSWKLIRFNSSI